MTKKRNWRHRLVIVAYRLVRWSHRRLPPVVRSLLGLLLMAAGVIGFLPVLGFWMIPLGLLVLSYEFHLVRRLRRRFVVWWQKRRRR